MMGRNNPRRVAGLKALNAIKENSQAHRPKVRLQGPANRAGGESDWDGWGGIAAMFLYMCFADFS